MASTFIGFRVISKRSVSGIIEEHNVTGSRLIHQILVHGREYPIVGRLVLQNHMHVVGILGKTKFWTRQQRLHGLHIIDSARQVRPFQQIKPARPRRITRFDFWYGPSVRFVRVDSDEKRSFRLSKSSWPTAENNEENKVNCKSKHTHPSQCNEACPALREGDFRSRGG